MITDPMSTGNAVQELLASLLDIATTFFVIMLRPMYFIDEIRYD